MVKTAAPFSIHVYSPYGLVESGWKRTENQITYQIHVPANTTAELILSGLESRTLGAGTYTIETE